MPCRFSFVAKHKVKGAEHFRDTSNTRLTRIENGQDRLNAKTDRLIAYGWTRH